MTEKLKVFNWYSETAAKEEYFEWRSQLQAECDAEGIGHTLNAVAADDQRPLALQHPGPNADAVDLREYQKTQITFRAEQRTWLTHHQKALGFIRKSLALGSKPMQPLWLHSQKAEESQIDALSVGDLDILILNVMQLIVPYAILSLKQRPSNRGRVSSVLTGQTTRKRIPLGFRSFFGKRPMRLLQTRTEMALPRPKLLMEITLRWSRCRIVRRLHRRH